MNFYLVRLLIFLKVCSSMKKFSSISCTSWCNDQTRGDCIGAKWNKYTLICESSNGINVHSANEKWVPRNESHAKISLAFKKTIVRTYCNDTAVDEVNMNLINQIANLRVYLSYGKLENVKVISKKESTTEVVLEAHLPFEDRRLQVLRLQFFDSTRALVQIPSKYCELSVTTIYCPTKNCGNTQYNLTQYSDNEYYSTKLTHKYYANFVQIYFVSFYVNPSCGNLTVEFTLAAENLKECTGTWERSTGKPTDQTTNITCYSDVKISEIAGLTLTASDSIKFIRKATVAIGNSMATYKFESYFDGKSYFGMKTFNTYDFNSCCEKLQVHIVAANNVGRYFSHFQIWTNDGKMCGIESPIGIYNRPLQGYRDGKGLICEGVCLNLENVVEVFMEVYEDNSAKMKYIKITKGENSVGAEDFRIEDEVSDGYSFSYIAVTS